MSNGPRFNLEFHSLQIVRHAKGFKATYSFTEGKFIIPSCDALHVLFCYRFWN